MIASNSEQLLSAPALGRFYCDTVETRSLHVQLIAPIATKKYSWYLQQRRFYSSDNGNDSSSLSSGGESSSTTTTTPSVEETLNRLFQEQADAADRVGTALSSSSAAAAAESATVAAWDPTWYNMADQAILTIKSFHELTGIEYGWSIVGVTVILRLALFPLMVQSQQTTSRMAHLQPELTMMKQRYEAIGTPSRQDQMQFSKQMQNLFAKYQVKPMRAFAAPLVQLPLFMGMFFGLRKMPAIYPNELSTGGMFWFPDLTVQDPLYILPIASASTFLLLIELGKDQMMASNPAQGQLFVNLFRVMAIVMIPVCVNFESAMLCYWTANNVLTLGQTATLKSRAVRKYFGIWDPPKPVPGQEPESLTDTAGKLIKRMQGEATTEKQKMHQHNQAVDAKKKVKAFQMMRSRQSSGQGITGKRGT